MLPVDDLFDFEWLYGSCWGFLSFMIVCVYVYNIIIIGFEGVYGDGGFVCFLCVCIIIIGIIKLKIHESIKTPRNYINGFVKKKC